MTCHSCKRKLERFVFRGHAFYRCPKCRGALFSFSALSAFPEARPIFVAVKLPSEATKFSSRICPICSEVMRSVTLEDRHFMRLETCDDCRYVWFEREEYQLGQGGQTTFAQRKESSLPIRSLVKRKPEESQSDDGLLTLDSHDGVPDSGSFLNYLFYLPDLENRNESKAEVWTIPILIGLCFIFSFSYKTGVRNLGFNTAEPWRLGGLTWITGVFLQMGFLHLISNGYFIYLLGTGLESLMGHWKVLSLFLLGGIGGNLFLVLLAPKGQMVAGASGAVMALLVYYACTYPRARLVFLKLLSQPIFGFQFITLKIKVNIWLVLVFYLIVDFAGAKDQLQNTAGISYLSHLGGALMGLLTWLADREDL